MICGLVGITPAAGFVNGLGAIVIGFVCSAIVWVAWTYLPRYVWPFNKVDDALGVVYTHGIAGLFGGLLVGLSRRPEHDRVPGPGQERVGFSGAGLFYGHPKQLAIQAGAALTIIVWDGLVTFIILRVLGLFMKLRIPDARPGDRRRGGARRGGLPLRGSGPRRRRLRHGVRTTARNLHPTLTGADADRQVGRHLTGTTPHVASAPGTTPVPGADVVPA